MKDLKDWMTLKEIEALYGIKPATIRVYILRGQVIPDDALYKLGNTWLVKKTWVQKKYEEKYKSKK